ncbi:putative lipoprotein [Vibrio maritimus]|uniref:Putative lipoprotein n=1 Tax=Vibrio maritimus TaxID=990268 RepID=A0A090TY95_9VIBR|nr:putative lipoprotein [Vibrio maritimus]
MQMHQFVCLILVLLMFGCSSSPHDQSTRVDESNYLLVQLGPKDEGKGLENEPYRFWGDSTPENLTDIKGGEIGEENIDLFRNSPDTPKVIGDRFNVLVLSGGGPRGAYGAGVLNGLRDQNKLPEFSLITGVSAGALIAPFVYVGGDKYDELKDVMLGSMTT